LLRPAWRNAGLSARRDQAPLRGQRRKASGSAGGSLLGDRAGRTLLTPAAERLRPRRCAPVPSVGGCSTGSAWNPPPPAHRPTPSPHADRPYIDQAVPRRSLQPWLVGEALCPGRGWTFAGHTWLEVGCLEVDAQAVRPTNQLPTSPDLPIAARSRRPLPLRASSRP